MLTSELLRAAPHGFTGIANGDFRAAGALERGQAVVAALGGSGPLHTVRQVHGTNIVLAPGPFDEAVGADAIVSTVPGAAVAVRVADCVPVLLFSPGGVAAVHAGWRGTAADIVRKAMQVLLTETGVPFASVRAAIGPCIRGCCYEVGDDVIAAVGMVAPGRKWVVGRHVDLAQANAAILASLGVPFEVVGGCTRCDDRFWSHRRDGDAAGRQIGVIAMPLA